jgi:metallo-beta-lactamase superfamily protein
MLKREVRVRMYKQGLGDCFLLTFPRESRPFHLLVDCGALNSRHYDSELMREVVQDIAEVTGGRIDALVATHEHWDHISGFHSSQAQELFDDIKVERVWVAWTEDPDSEDARELKKEFGKHKIAVQMAINRLPDDVMEGGLLGHYRKAITELFGFFGGLGAAGDSKTSAAWEYLLGKGPNLYCDPKNRPFELKGVEGIRVYVLGPPADISMIRKLLSSKETYHGAEPNFARFESFLNAVAPDCDPLDNRLNFPFEARYRIAQEEAKQTPFFMERYGFDAGAEEEWRRIDSDWLSVAGELALHLDSYTNNTCLAFAIELIESGKVLLFPGDAQVGNWLSWGDLFWKVKDADGKTQRVTINDLLARTVFYKVGHHGSHNATLRAHGLEKMESPDLVAMIPVHRKTAKDQDWEFPFPPLYKRLKERSRGRVLLADFKSIQEIAKEAQKYLSPDEWEAFTEATKFEELYIEHSIPY